MKQALHIFKKDVREFWPEILASLAIAAGLLWVLPMQWMGPQVMVWGADNSRMMSLMVTGRGLEVLLVLSWAVLLVRVVHAEALVGDRHFWLTKPYAWRQLLSAKALFLAGFVLLPLLTMQCGVLLRAGLSPLAWVGGLSFNLLLIVGMLLLPLIAIAAVTADFRRTTLVVLGALLGVGVLVTMVTLRMSVAPQGPFLIRLLFLAMGDPFLPSRDNMARGHHSQLPIALLLILFCGVAVVLQYALRRTWISRSVLLAVPVALTAVVMITAHGHGPAKPFTDPVFASLSQSAAVPVQFTYVPDEKHSLSISRGKEAVGVSIPLHVSGVAADAAVIAGAYPTIEFGGADGFKWSGTVTEFYPEKFLPYSRRTHAGLMVPHDVYDRLKRGPVTIRVTTALVQLHAAINIHMTMPDGDTVVPGMGVCWRPDRNHGLLTCRSALREPRLVHASAAWSTTPCPDNQIKLEEVRGDDWAGMLDGDPAEFGISPILMSGLSLMSDWNNTTGGKYLCSGSQVTLTQYELVGRMQSTVTISNLTLPED